MGYITFEIWTVGGYGVETDFFRQFLPAAQGLLDGDLTVMNGFKGPGYYAALAAIGLLQSDLFLAAKILTLLSTVAVLGVVVWLVVRGLGWIEAWIVLGVITTNAIFVRYSFVVGTDMFFFAMAIGVMAILLAKRGDLRWLAGAGMLAAWAYLTRYNGVFLLVSAIPVLLLVDRNTLSLRRRVEGLSAFLATAAVPITMWGAYTHQQGKGVFFNRNYKNIAYELYGRDQVYWDQFWAQFSGVFTSFGDVIGGDPAGFFWMVLRNTFDHLWQDMVTLMGVGFSVESELWPLWLPLLLLGAAGVWRSIGWPSSWPGGFPALYFAILVPVFYGERFSLPLVAAYATVIAVGVNWSRISDGFKLGAHQMSVRGSTLVLLLLLSAINTIARTQDYLANSPDEVKAVADRFLETNLTRPGEIVLARKPHIAYCLDEKNVTFLQIPTVRGISELIEFAVEKQATYLLMTSMEAQTRPPLRGLLDPRKAPATLVFVAGVYTNGRPAALYRFNLADIPRQPTEPTQTVHTKPEKPQLSFYARLGDAYIAAGNKERAMWAYQKLLNGSDADAIAWTGIGRAELIAAPWPAPLPDISKAQNSFERAIAIDSTLTEAPYQLGRIAASASDWQTAAPYLAQAVHHDSTHADAQRLYAEALLYHGDVEGSAAHLSAAVRQRPTDAAIRRRLAELFEQLSWWDQAAEQWEAVVRMTQADGETYFLLGRSLLRLGETDGSNGDAINTKARDALLESIRRAPDSAGSHHDLALAESRLGHIDAAILHMTRAKELGDLTAAIELEKLQQ